MADPHVSITRLKELWRQLVKCKPALTSSPGHIMVERAPQLQYLWGYVPNKLYHSSSETAIAFALYSFGWVASLSLLSQCGNLAAEYAELINGHCETILDAAAFASAIQDRCSYIRMTTPLKTVVCYSSNPTQRERAMIFMQMWGKPISLVPRRFKTRNSISHIESCNFHRCNNREFHLSLPWLCILLSVLDYSSIL